jgi:hypothetical protein
LSDVFGNVPFLDKFTALTILLAGKRGGGAGSKRVPAREPRVNFFSFSA